MLSFVLWSKNKFKKVKETLSLLSTHTFSHLLKCWEIICLSKQRFEHTRQALQAPKVLQFWVWAQPPKTSYLWCGYHAIPVLFFIKADLARL